MGLGALHVKSPERRDRLWLINSFAVVLLTLLGAAGRRWATTGCSRPPPAPRPAVVSSGLYALRSDPDDAPEIRLRPLMRRFSQMLQDQPLFADVFGPV